jgi:hypothetical protein
MNILPKLLVKPNRGPEQAVLVHLDGQGLPANVYEEHDLSTIEDQLEQILGRKKVGSLDGNEIGPTGATLFMYGPDAEKLFSAVRPTLEAYPLCQKARVVIRFGGPGAAERVVVLGIA